MVFTVDVVDKVMIDGRFIAHRKPINQLCLGQTSYIRDLIAAVEERKDAERRLRRIGGEFAVSPAPTF
jgi:hypothetical protein